MNLIEAIKYVRDTGKTAKCKDVTMRKQQRYIVLEQTRGDWFVFAEQEANLLLDFAKHDFEPEIDWSKVKKDTKVYVRDHECENWGKQYFAEYKDGKYYCYDDGSTSWTAIETLPWKYCKLAEEEE